MKQYFTSRSISAVVCIAVLLFGYIFIRVENIICKTTDEAVCPEEQELLQLRSASLFFTDFAKQQAVLEYAAKHNMSIKNYELHLPNTITLFFEENPLAYSIELETGTAFAVTQLGSTKILANSSTAADTPIRLQANETLLPHNSSQIPKKLHIFFLEFSKTMTPAELSNRILTLHPDFVEIISADAIRAYLPYEHPEQKVAQLKQILQSQSLTTLNKPIREIDLRFDLPVLRTQQ